MKHPPFRLLPLIIVVGTLAFGLQAGYVANGVFALSDNAALASEAQDETNTSNEAETAEDQGTIADNTEVQDAASDAGNILVEADEDELDPAFMTRSEVELLRDLAKRRTELEKREKQIVLQEGLLQATEKRIDDKIAELKAYEERISGIVGQVEEEENKQFDSLVRVYEKMKAKDSAAIFQTLDLEIQIAVAKRMKDTKLAEMLAKMNTQAANALSTALAESRMVPELQTDS